MQNTTGVYLKRIDVDVEQLRVQAEFLFGNYSL